MDIEGLVKKFLADEKFTLRNALAYAGLGLSKTTGDINSTATDIAFRGHSYGKERKKRMAEQLGEMMFYWHVLASTCDSSPDEIIQDFIGSYLVKNNQMSEELHVSILELMKHIKTDVAVKEIDESERQKARQLLKEMDRIGRVKEKGK